MNDTIVVVLMVLVALAAVGSVQLLARVIAAQELEPSWRLLATGGRGPRAVLPPELAQLESLVSDTLAGDPAAAARLAARLHAAGCPVATPGGPAQVVAALAGLGAAGAAGTVGTAGVVEPHGG